MTITAIRTPEERFASLPDWPYRSRYVDDLPGYEGLRLAYVDEGPADARKVFLCLHGQPTWGYTYRQMIPVFLESGARVVAPDMFGFGRSDKPLDEGVHSFTFHRHVLMTLIALLDLRGITLVCQDWGGLLGLTLPPEMPARFERLLTMNTVPGLGQGTSPGFEAWRRFHRENPDYDLAAVMRAHVPSLGADAAAAYAAPFPDRAYRAAIRRFPELVMTRPEMEGVAISQRAFGWYRTAWKGDGFMAIGMQDTIVAPSAMERIGEMLGIGRAPLRLAEAGYFVQEHGAQVARAALGAWGDLPPDRRADGV